jgi:hypothetical protein
LYLRAEAGGSPAGKKSISPTAKKSQALGTAVVASKYSALTQENRELVDEFMALLLRRQRSVRSQA